jgi:drug/metabolite transporter (DMT)-like permease
VNKKLIDWLIFGILALIWGSSFILMKIGLDNHISPYNIAATRIVASGLVLLPIAVRSFTKILVNKLPLVFLSGVLGSLLPAFLFCYAEQGMDSSLAGTLNSLTPIFVIITGALFFNRNTPFNKVIGIIIAFAGSILLLLSKGHIQESNGMLYPLLIIIATIMYGFNVNLVSKYLSHLPSLQIASVALTLNALPALGVLFCTGFFSGSFQDTGFLKGVAAAMVLGIGGTAVATILFYMLVKRAGGIFASMVTYGIPFVAIGWGVYFNEKFGWAQVGCLLIILTGVYWTNKKTAGK